MEIIRQILPCGYSRIARAFGVKRARAHEIANACVSLGLLRVVKVVGRRDPVFDRGEYDTVCSASCPHSQDANPLGSRWCRKLDKLVKIGQECEVVG